MLDSNILLTQSCEQSLDHIKVICVNIHVHVHVHIHVHVSVHYNMIQHLENRLHVHAKYTHDFTQTLSVPVRNATENLYITLPCGKHA